MTRMIRLLPVSLLLAGCDGLERINAQNNEASVQVAALQSQAIVGAEWARTQAAASVAQSRAMSEVATNAAWASQLPWVVMALCVTVVILGYFWYRSRIAYASYSPPARILPPTSPRQAALDFAHQHGGQLVETPDGRVFVQVGGQRRQLRITARREN